MKNNRITQSIIIGLTTLLAAFSWAGLENILSGNNNNWILPSVCLLTLFILLSLSLLLIKSKSVLLITLATILVSFLFSFGFKLEYSATLLLAFLFFVFGSFRIINEKEVRIKFKVIRILKYGLPHILTGFAIIIAIAYYFSPLAIKGENRIEIPRQLFDITIQPVMDTLELPNNEEFTDILYITINQEINKRSEAYKDYLSIGFAFGIFFAIKVISIVFMWFVLIITWIIFKFLRSSNAIKIQEQSVLKEVIEI
ncbi:MAG: hypothetical protein ABIG88_03670 [Patescibacteria group bacterium]